MQTLEQVEKKTRIKKAGEKVGALRKEMAALIPHLRGTPLFKEAESLAERAWRVDMFCFACYFSFLEGYEIDDESIAELESEYERVRRDWDEFVRRNHLAVVLL
jgi:hypothetical protein